jgi:hypothetical protein
MTLDAKKFKGQSIQVQRENRAVCAFVQYRLRVLPGVEEEGRLPSGFFLFLVEVPLSWLETARA